MHKGCGNWTVDHILNVKSNEYNHTTQANKAPSVHFSLPPQDCSVQEWIHLPLHPSNSSYEHAFGRVERQVGSPNVHIITHK